MEAVFINNVPMKITAVDFRRFHLQSFPSLREPEFDEFIENAIETVYTMFPGAATAWEMQTKQVWFEKTRLVYRLLTAWLIADQYPELTSSIVTIDGIKQKKIDGVSITFSPEIFSGSNPLMWLRSNDFGRKVLMMAGTMPGRALLRVSKYV